MCHGLWTSKCLYITLRSLSLLRLPSNCRTSSLKGTLSILLNYQLNQHIVHLKDFIKYPMYASEGLVGDVRKRLESNLTGFLSLRTATDPTMNSQHKTLCIRHDLTLVGTAQLSVNVKFTPRITFKPF